MAQIIVMDGPGSGTTFELVTVNNIGRGSNCNIQLQSPNIAPIQAIIKKKTNNFMISSSIGSVLVNGQPIHKERKLIHGDMITLADIMLLFGEENSSPTSAPPMTQGETQNKEPTVTNTQAYFQNTSDALKNLANTANPSGNMEVLIKVSNAIMSKLEPKELLAQLLDIIFDELPAVDRGMVLLKESETSSKLWPMASKKRSHIQQDVMPSRTIIKRVLQQKEGVLTEDAAGDFGGEDLNISIVNNQIKAAICVPLVGKNNNILGIIHLDSTERGRDFREEQLRLVTAIAMQASLAMENAILVKHLGEKQRMQQELDIANDIQMQLLPKNLPQVQGVEVYGLMKPAKEVGGDYYDFLIPENSNNKKLFICIGDVSGKGVPAGLVMVMARCFFRPLIISCKNTKMIIEEMNKFLVEDTRRDMFMSMLVLSWDIEQQQFQWTGAGHEHMLVYRAQTKKCEAIRAGGIVLGMMKKANRFFKDNYLSLQSGDAIVLYTDGVTEGINPQKKMFELNNLITLVEKYGSLSAEKICKNILEDLKRFMSNAPQHDDITLVAIKKI